MPNESIVDTFLILSMLESDIDHLGAIEPPLSSLFLLLCFDIWSRRHATLWDNAARRRSSLSWWWWQESAEYYTWHFERREASNKTGANKSNCSIPINLPLHLPILIICYKLQIISPRMESLTFSEQKRVLVNKSSRGSDRIKLIPSEIILKNESNLAFSKCEMFLFRSVGG